MAEDDKKAGADDKKPNAAKPKAGKAEAKPVSTRAAKTKPAAKAKPAARAKPAAKTETKPAPAKKLVKKAAAKKAPDKPAPAAPERMEVRRKISDLKELGGAVETAGASVETAAAASAPAGAAADAETGAGALRQPQRDAQGRAYATGRRKDAVARVWIKPGQGLITVNGKDSDTYFARPVLRMLITQPMVASRRETEFDIWCTVKGGGLSGQAGAVRHGISRALVNYDPELRGVLKAGGFMTRDSRVVDARNTVAPRPAAASSSPSAKPQSGHRLGDPCRPLTGGA